MYIHDITLFNLKIANNTRMTISVTKKNYNKKIGKKLKNLEKDYVKFDTYFNQITLYVEIMIL